MNDDASAGHRCENTGRPVDQCRCLDCWPRLFRFSRLCEDCNTIADVLSSLAWAFEFFEELETQGYEIDGDIQHDHMELVPPLVNGCYWTRCVRCGEPVLVDEGNTEDQVCSVCVARGLADREVKTYGDLFEYVDSRCTRRENGRTLLCCSGPLVAVDEFCERHGLDAETVKDRLRENGGYCDCEVMMNCVETIPALDILPRLTETGVGNQGTGERRA